jgi:hypothetical protein
LDCLKQQARPIAQYGGENKDKSRKGSIIKSESKKIGNEIKKPSLCDINDKWLGEHLWLTGSVNNVELL